MMTLDFDNSKQVEKLEQRAHAILNNDWDRSKKIENELLPNSRSGLRKYIEPKRAFVTF